MSAVLPFVSQSKVEAAWDDLAKHRRRLLDDPSLIADRQWVEDDGRLHARFIRLFMASEPPCEVVALERAG